MNYYLLQVRIAVLVSLTLLNSQHLLLTFICQVSVQLASSKSSLEDALLHKNVDSIYVITHPKKKIKILHYLFVEQNHNPGSLVADYIRVDQSGVFVKLDETR